MQKFVAKFQYFFARWFTAAAFILFAIKIPLLFSQETCSRIATINYQEVLVDSNSVDKGEGLRFHLEKDPIALEHLNNYQKSSSHMFTNAVVGTVGTGLLLYGFFSPGAEDRNIFIASGIATIFINYLISRTLDIQSETHLDQAIEEYNKRNLPKIYFKESEDQASLDFPHQFKQNLTLNIGHTWNF